MDTRLLGRIEQKIDKLQDKASETVTRLAVVESKMCNVESDINELKVEQKRQSDETRKNGWWIRNKLWALLIALIAGGGATAAIKTAIIGN